MNKLFALTILAAALACAPMAKAQPLPYTNWSPGITCVALNATSNAPTASSNLIQTLNHQEVAVTVKFKLTGADTSNPNVTFSFITNPDSSNRWTTTWLPLKLTVPANGTTEVVTGTNFYVGSFANFGLLSVVNAGATNAVTNISYIVTMKHNRFGK